VSDGRSDNYKVKYYPKVDKKSDITDEIMYSLLVSDKDKATKGAEGDKLDQGKPKVSLIPTEAILEMAKAFTYGANKYEADNFKKGIAYRKLIDAALRHILAISAGEDVDDESKNNHVGHAMASLAMLCYMMKHRPDLDDRYKGDK